MSSPFLRALPIVAVGLLAACGPKPLRVCADPNDLPFSNQAGEGFENRIMAVVAAELHRPLVYTWRPQRRGYVRETVKAGACDVWPGVAQGLETLSVARPYYRGRYVFVTRADRELDLKSFDDPRLRTLTVGVQLVGDDGANTPPAHALSRRGLTSNVRGFMIFGDYASPAPGGEIVAAVDRGDIDAAVVWGPTAAYHAARAAHVLKLTPAPDSDGGLPMRFDLGMGVAPIDRHLARDLDAALVRRRGEVATILRHAGVEPIGPVR
jgi:mxaJ protein